MWARLLPSSCHRKQASSLWVIFFFLSTFFQGWAQNDTAILVLQDPQGQPLSGAFVHSIDFDFQISTNADGIAKVTEWPDVDSLCFTYFGYDMKFFSIADLRKQGKTKVILTPLSQSLDEIVVIGRNDADRRTLPYQIDQIKAKEIAFSQSQTSADVLSNLSNVFVQKSQMGGGSPVIRGFEANRVLLVVDGVRMNNIIYRSGHLQNAITVDASTLSQLEVIHGPGSLLYGSDALGGVVHFRTKDPQLGQDGNTLLSLNTYGRFSSANREKTGHVDLNLGGKKLAYWGSFTFSDFDDLKAGQHFSDRYPDYGKRTFYVDVAADRDLVVENDTPYRQIGTAYDQYDMVHKLKWAPSIQLQQTFNLQFSRSSNIPRYDQLAEFGEDPIDLTFAEWYYGPQQRLMVSSRTQWFGKSTLVDRALVIASFQDLNEDRISRRLNRIRRSHQEEDVKVYTLTVDLQKDLQQRWKLSYGASIDYNSLQSTAYSTFRNGGDIRFDELSRYPDADASMRSYGIYTNLTKAWSEHSTANVGLRYSDIQTDFAYTRDLINWPQRFFDGIVNQNSAFTWGLSLHTHLARNTQFSVSTGTAFRAPNIDDLAKIRIKSGSASAPNPSLKPEHAWQGEINITQEIPSHYGQQFLSLTGYVTRLKDAIVQVPARLPNGDSVLSHQGEWFRIVANANANIGRIWGVSANAKFYLMEHLSVSASINYVQGETESIDEKVEPMAHIPPIYGRINLQWVRERWKVEGVIRFNGAKPLDEYSSNSADNLELATPEGTLRWTTVNLYSSFEINKHLKAQLALENLTDRHYRPFASGVSAPGRNISLSLFAMI